MPVTVTRLGALSFSSEDWPPPTVYSGSIDIGSGAGDVFVLVTAQSSGISGVSVDGSAATELVSYQDETIGLSIWRATPVGTGTVTASIAGAGYIFSVTAQFYRVAGAGDVEDTAGWDASGSGGWPDYEKVVPIDTVADGATLAVADGHGADVTFVGFTVNEDATYPSFRNISGWRPETSSGTGSLTTQPMNASRGGVAVSLAPGGGPEPVVYDLPVVSYSLTIPAPTLLKHRVFALPVVSYGLTIPAPSITRGRVFDLPAVSYGLTIPAPSILRHRVFSLPVVEYGVTIPAAGIIHGRTFDLPLVSYALTIPAPSLIRHQVFDLPVVDYGLTIPAPQIVRGRVFDLPVVEYGLTIPAMELVRGRVFDLPVVEYGLTIPALTLLRHRIIDLPLVSYGLTIPAMTVVHPGSSQRRAAEPGDSASGGLFTIRAPGALVSDGITGGTIERG